MNTQNATAPATAQHTPGPWESYTSPTGISYISVGGLETILARVARLDDGINNDAREREAQANARLIAAAPDLLAALREALTWCETHKRFNQVEDGGPLDGSIAKCHEAITKATAP